MKTNLLWCTVFFAMLSVMAEDKTIWSCSSVSEMAGKGIVPFASKGYRCSTSIPADVKTPDSEPVIAFKVETPPGAAGFTPWIGRPPSTGFRPMQNRWS